LADLGVVPFTRVGQLTNEQRNGILVAVGEAQ
jgi:hypothetical protein